MLAIALVLVPVAAGAEGIGVYAPAAPFAGPVARLEYATTLAEKMGLGLSGHAYAKASDFAAAVKRGEISYAVVDAAYLAAIGSPWPVLAAAQRGGESEAAWQVVSARPASSLVALRGAVAAVPSIGARDEGFLFQVLLEGELGRDFFAKVSYAPDALSALAAVERGRADCALVPSGLALPPGVQRVTTLGAVAFPVLVALPGAQRPDAVAAAALRVTGTVLEGFVASGDAPVRALAARLARPVDDRRPPLVVPALRPAVGPLVSGRTYSMDRPPLAGYLVEPAPPANHR